MMTGHPSAAIATKPRHFYGFSKRRHDGRFVAVCMQPYLVTEGESHADVQKRMHKLIKAYVQDAVKDQNPHLLSRRAPIALHAEYLLALTFHAIGRSCQVFTETCQIPQLA